VSRDFSEDQHLEVIVAIDAGRTSALGAGDVDRLSLYVNVAARFAQRAVSLEDAVGVVVFAAQPLAVLAPARGEAAVARIRDLLTACRVQPGDSNPVLAAARIRTLAQRRSLILMLTDLEDASAGSQLVRAVRLLTPKHLPFIAGFRSAHIEALARSPARDPLSAYRALAAIEYTNTMQAMCEPCAHWGRGAHCSAGGPRGSSGRRVPPVSGAAPHLSGPVLPSS